MVCRLTIRTRHARHASAGRFGFVSRSKVVALGPEQVGDVIHACHHLFIRRRGGGLADGGRLGCEYEQCDKSKTLQHDDLLQKSCSISLSTAENWAAKVGWFLSCFTYSIAAPSRHSERTASASRW